MNEFIPAGHAEFNVDEWFGCWVFEDEHVKGCFNADARL